MERGGLGGQEPQRLGVAVDRPFQVGRPVPGRKSPVGFAQVVLGRGVVERGGLGGAEPQRLGEAVDGAFEVGYLVPGRKLGIGVAQVVLGRAYSARMVLAVKFRSAWVKQSMARSRLTVRSPSEDHSRRCPGRPGRGVLEPGGFGGEEPQPLGETSTLRRRSPHDPPRRAGSTASTWSCLGPSRFRQTPIRHSALLLGLTAGGCCGVAVEGVGEPGGGLRGCRGWRRGPGVPIPRGRGWRAPHGRTPGRRCWPRRLPLPTASR